MGARVKDGDRCSLMLLKSGANPNITTENGQTPVHVAAHYGNVDTMDLLLEDGGDPLLKSHVRMQIALPTVSLTFLGFRTARRPSTCPADNATQRLCAI